MNLELEKHEIITSSQIEITWANVTVKTKRGEVLLDDVSGQIKSGSVTGLLGPSGCGKTTLINVLTGNIKGLKTRGDIFFNNERINIKHTSKLIAHVSQSVQNYQSLTALETLIYYAELKNNFKHAKYESKKLLRDFGLYEQENEKWSSLSGGQKLRLALAAAVVKDTPIIILDEPTSGLDSSSAMIVIEKMEELAKSGKTLLISIHQPSEELLRIFDGFILMSKGNIVFMGTVKTADEHFAKLGFVNPKNSSVNSAEFYSRLVAVDFRSEEKIQNSKVNIHKIINAWRSKKHEYNIASLPKIHISKKRMNSRLLSLVKIFWKSDLRSKNELLFIILSLIVVSCATWRFLTFRVSVDVVFDFIQDMGFALTRFPNRRLSYKMFSNAFQLDSVSHSTYVSYLKECLEHLRTSGYKIIESRGFCRCFKGVFAVVMLVCLPGLNTLSNNTNVLQRDFNSSVFTSAELVLSILFYIFPYMILHFLPIGVFLYAWFLFDKSFLIKIFAIYLLVSYIAYMGYMCLIFLLPFTNEFRATFVYYFKTLGPFILLVFDTTYKHILPIGFLKTKSYDISELFLACFEDQFFIVAIVLICFLLIFGFATIFSAEFSYKNVLKYTPINKFCS